MTSPSLIVDLNSVGSLRATDLGGRVNLGRYTASGQLRAGALVKDVDRAREVLAHGGAHGASGLLVVCADYGQRDVLLPEPRPGRHQDTYACTRLTAAHLEQLDTFLAAIAAAAALASAA